jgi:hypothetical protein
MRFVIALLLIGLMAAPALAGPPHNRGGWGGHRSGWGWGHHRPHYRAPDLGVGGGFLGGIIGGWIGSQMNKPEPPPPVQNWCIEPDGSRHPC